MASSILHAIILKSTTSKCIEELLGGLSAFAVICCGGFAHKRYKARSKLRATSRDQAKKLKNAIAIAKHTMQEVNGVTPQLNLKADKIIVDQHTGHVVTHFAVIDITELSKPQPKGSSVHSVLTKGMARLWKPATSDEPPVPDDQIMELTTSFCAETKVNGSAPQEVSQSEVPSCLLVLGHSSENLLFHGFRDGPWITIPWHGLQMNPSLATKISSKHSIFVRCLRTGKEKECKVEGVITHSKNPNKMDSLRGTGLDAVALKLSKDDWSSLGATSLCGSKRSNPFMTANGYTIHCFSQDFKTGKLYKSQGNIIPSTELGKVGLIKHTCNTEAGISGAPLWSLVNGRLLWSGMHVGNWGDSDFNVGVSVSAYGYLRKLAGLVVKTPKVSNQMLAAIDGLSETAPAKVQNFLDTYLAQVSEDLDEYDGTKLAPKYPEQIPPALHLEALSSNGSIAFGPASIASFLTSSDSSRSYQTTLDSRDYQHMTDDEAASGQYDHSQDQYDDEEEDAADPEERMLIGHNKASRRAHKEAHDFEDHRDALAERWGQAEEVDALIHGNAQEHRHAAQDLSRVVRLPGQQNRGIRAITKGTPWEDFEPQAIVEQIVNSSLTPLKLAALSRCGPPSESERPEPSETTPSDLPCLEPVPPGLLAVNLESDVEAPPISFQDLKHKVICQAASSVDQKERDDMAKLHLGFDHANYASSSTVIETEDQLRTLTTRHDPSPIASDLIRDIMLGHTTLSISAVDLRNGVSYSDLREHPCLQDFWEMVDTTAERKDVTSRTLEAKNGNSAVSKDGSPMARVVAEISPAFKGGTTTQPQLLDPQTRESLKQMESHFRREVTLKGDLELKDALVHSSINWDWALPPTSSSAVIDSLVSQLKRLPKGGFKNYSTIAAKIDRHWAQIISRYETVDVTGDLDRIGCRIDDAFDAFDLTKSSGWSSRVLPGTKEVWSKGPNRIRIEEWVRARLLVHTVLGPTLIGRMSPYLLIRSGCKDPEELFIKMEVHKPKKQQSHRWRLIWNPSLLDTLVLHALHVRTNKSSLEAYETGRMTHQVLGMGHHDEGVEHLGKIIDSLYCTGEPVTTSDASAWDFSVRRDGFFLDAYRRIANTKSSSLFEKALFDDLLLAQASLLSSHVVAVGRDLIEILHFGILSSGILSTGDINSFLRTTYAFCAGAVATMACSDDLVAAGRMDLGQLEDFGIVDPEVQEVPEGHPIDFTSHLFLKRSGKWVAVYNNVDKLFNGLILKNMRVDGNLVYPGEETASGHRFALRHNLFASKFYEKLFEVFSWNLPAASPFAIATY